MNKVLRTTLALGLAATLGIGLAACSKDEPQAGGTGSPGEVAAGPAGETVDDAVATEKEGKAEFGEAFRYDNGLEVTMMFLGYQEVSGDAKGASEGQAAVFELTVVNGSKEAVDASKMSKPKVTFGDAGKLAEITTDEANDLLDYPLGKIEPGQGQGTIIAYGIPEKDASKVKAEVPAADKPAVFEGSLQGPTVVGDEPVEESEPTEVG